MQKWTNNATSTLASGITNVAASLTVATGEGALFPALTGSDYFLCTLEAGSVREIVKVTARSGDVFTIVRAQEGTTGVAWLSGDTVSLRLTAALLTSLTDFKSFTHMQPGGRLTGTTGVPVMIADDAAITTIYYTPYRHYFVPIFDGTNYVNTSIAAQLSVALDPTSGHTGYHQTGKIFDFFVFNDAGTIRLGSGPAWTSLTGRGTGAGTTELSFGGQAITNAVSMTARFGSSSGNTVTVAANQGTYVGSVYMTSDGTTKMMFAPAAASGGANNHLAIYNAYNRVLTHSHGNDSTSSWTYGTAGDRAINNSTSNRVTWLDGLAQSFVRCWYLAGQGSSPGVTTYTAIGIDTTSGPSNSRTTGNNASLLSFISVHSQAPLLGLHYMQPLEYSQAGNSTFYGGSLSDYGISLEM